MRRTKVVSLIVLMALLAAGIGVQSAQAQGDFDCATATGLPQAECEALVALYEATGGDNWHDNTDWLQTTTPCDWYGVRCFAEKVIELDLERNNLLGALPAEIGSLSALEYLDLAGNQLTRLPAEIRNLGALDELDLDDNQLTSLPAEIGNLSALETLDLDGNQLTSLPAEIGNMTGLQWLYLSDNQLTSLSGEIGNLTRLETLDLYDNQLTSLPGEIGNLSALYSLGLTGNQLTSLPAEIGNLSVLEGLYLRGNQLTSLPAEIGNLTGLHWLDLTDNQLTALPTQIGNMSTLCFLHLTGNQLTSLPSEIGNLTFLGLLYLEDNQLTSLPAAFGNLTSLQELYLSGNQLTTLPAEIGNLSALEELYLQDNQLMSLPGEIGNLSRLMYLELADNQLTALPGEVGNLSALEGLYLERNQLTSLPAEIGSLSALHWLDLEDNQLTSLPAEIGNMTGWVSSFDLSGNQLTSLPEELGNMTGLGGLYLHDNPLSGELPAFLTSLTSLYGFTFYGTDWCVPATGEVPAWLDGIANVYGTGQVCGEAPGRLRGNVTWPDAAPTPEVQVNLYQPVGWENWHYVTTTHVLMDGSYQVGGLGQGIDYRVQFVDLAHRYGPQYYDEQSTLESSTVVTVTLGTTRTGIDAALDQPRPPLAVIEADAGSVTPNPQDGTLTVNMTSSDVGDVAVTRVVTCASGSPSGVTLVLTPTAQTYPMVPVGADQYRATVPGADVTEDADLVVAAACGGTPTGITVGHINLYEPSSTVTDARTGQPVADATVTLYRVPGWEPKTGPDDDRPNTCESNLSKDPGASWSQPAPTDLGVVVNPEVTDVAPALFYQLTDETGSYGWEVEGGCWYVQVTAAGYQPLVSPVVGVPQAITDLDLALDSAPLAKSATPAHVVANGSPITYTLILSNATDTTLHLYDPLDRDLQWKGFVGEVPGTVTHTRRTLTGSGSLVYTTSVLVGAVDLSAATPLSVTFVVTVDLPETALSGGYAQVGNTAYYYLPGGTLTTEDASNTVTHTVYKAGDWFEIFLPLVLRGFS